MALQAWCVGSLANAPLTCLTKLHLIPIEDRGASLCTVIRRLSALEFTLWTESLFTMFCFMWIKSHSLHKPLLAKQVRPIFY